MEINVTGGTIEQKEIDAYVERAKRKYPDAHIRGMDIHIDGDYVELRYHLEHLPEFQRIRRITGYLVGTLDRFNNAKRCEEHDRVKHGVSGCTVGCKA